VTVLFGCSLALIGFVLGLLAQDWATRGLDQAVADSRRQFPDRYGTTEWSGREIPDLTPYGLGLSSLDDKPESFRALGERFPNLTFGQIANLLMRRRQERHHG
jgi:hypothetical protein